MKASKGLFALALIAGMGASALVSAPAQAAGDTARSGYDLSAKSASGEKLPIAPKCEIKHTAVVACQGLELFSVRGVPQFDFLIVTSSGKGLAIGRNCHGVECVAVSLESPHQLAVVDRPLPHLTGQARFARSREQVLAVL